MESGVLVHRPVNFILRNVIAITFSQRPVLFSMMRSRTT